MVISHPDIVTKDLLNSLDCMVSEQVAGYLQYSAVRRLTALVIPNKNHEAYKEPFYDYFLYF